MLFEAKSPSDSATRQQNRNIIFVANNNWSKYLGSGLVHIYFSTQSKRLCSFLSFSRGNARQRPTTSSARFKWKQVDALSAMVRQYKPMIRRYMAAAQHAGTQYSCYTINTAPVTLHFVSSSAWLALMRNVIPLVPTRPARLVTHTASTVQIARLSSTC